MPRNTERKDQLKNTTQDMPKNTGRNDPQRNITPRI